MAAKSLAKATNKNPGCQIYNALNGRSAQPMKGFQTNCRFVMEIDFFASKRVIDIQEVKCIDLNCQLSLHLSFLKNLRRVSEQLWREYHGMSLDGLK